jgi:hypothetical protein
LPPLQRFALLLPHPHLESCFLLPRRPPGRTLECPSCHGSTSLQTAVGVLSETRVSLVLVALGYSGNSPSPDAPVHAGWQQGGQRIAGGFRYSREEYASPWDRGRRKRLVFEAERRVMNASTRRGSSGVSSGWAISCSLYLGCGRKMRPMLRARQADCSLVRATSLRDPTKARVVAPAALEVEPERLPGPRQASPYPQGRA